MGEQPPITYKNRPNTAADDFITLNIITGEHLPVIRSLNIFMVEDRERLERNIKTTHAPRPVEQNGKADPPVLPRGPKAYDP